MNRITLIHRGEYIFIKLKLNHYVFSLGIICLLFLISEWKELEYINYLKAIGVISCFYLLTVWIITILVTNKVKKDIKDLISY